MIAVKRTEEFPDEIGPPGTDGFGPGASTLLQAIIHRFEEGELALDFLILLHTVSSRKAGVGKGGELIEFGKTDRIFIKPERKQTEDYITGRFG